MSDAVLGSVELDGERQCCMDGRGAKAAAKWDAWGGGGEGSGLWWPWLELRLPEGSDKVAQHKA